MKQLIWKEYREKRWWFVPVALFPLGCVLTRWGYTFVGLEGPGSAAIPQASLSGMIALLMGLSGYAPELGGRTADFLYGKPVSWKEVLLAKAAVALAIIVASVGLAAIVYRLTCPAPYLPFATLPVLAKGGAVGALFMVAGYLLGLCCSVALPGMLGSVLTFASVAALFAAAEALFSAVGGPGLPNVTYFYVFLAACLALILTAALTIRFGLTLSLGARVRRYAIVFVIMFVLGCVAATYLGQTVEPLFVTSRTDWKLSPSGRYVSRIVVPFRLQHYPGSVRIWRLSDGASGEIPASGSNTFSLFWTSNDVAYALYHRDGRMGPTTLRFVWLDGRGKLYRKAIGFPDATYAYVSPSPSGDRAVVSWSTAVDSRSAEFRHLLVDTASQKVLNTPIPDYATSPEWISDSEVRFLNNKHNFSFRIQVKP